MTAGKPFSRLSRTAACLLVGLVIVTPQKPNMFMVRLPAGEYRMVYKAMYPCRRDTRNDTFALNIYLSKKSINETEIKGNMTFRAPIDDTLILELNMASWGSTGGWKENSFHIRSEKFCSSGKKLMGEKMWHNWLDGFNVSKRTCPLPMGVYVTSGLNTKTVDDHSLPKVYFYGRYKLTLMAKTRKNLMVGCFVMELNLVRPWEVNLGYY